VPDVLLRGGRADGTVYRMDTESANLILPRHVEPGEPPTYAWNRVTKRMEPVWFKSMTYRRTGETDVTGLVVYEHQSG